MGTITPAGTNLVGASSNDKKKKSSTLSSNPLASSSSSSSSGATRTASEAAASGDFETPFNGKKRTSSSRNNESYSGGSTGSGTTNYNTYGTYKEDLDRLTKARRQAQIDALKEARTKALANLDVQEQEIKPYYINARNQTAASSQQGARSFAEYLANRGLTNSGAAAQAETIRQSNLVNNLGNINTAEANALRNIANQRTAVENEYISGLANANNSITNDYYKDLLNYNEQQRQKIEALQQQALGQYAGDYQAYMNTLDPNSMEYLYAAAARGNKVANQYNNAMANAQNNILAGNINYNNAAQLGMTVPQAQQYYETYQAAQQAQKQAQQDSLNREIAQQNWENAYKENQLGWNQNMDYQNYLLNAQKVANDTAKTNYDINKPYYKPTVAKTTTDSGVTGLIQNLIARGYSDQEIADLING